MDAGKKGTKPGILKQAAELLSSSPVPAQPKPKLYNWVRAIRKISFISACFTSFVVCLSIIWAGYLEFNKVPASTDNNLLISIFSTILLTAGLRKIGLRKLHQHFIAKRNFEYILGFWCITLLIIHLLCQLMALAAASFESSIVVKTAAYIFISAVIIYSWPKTESIQKLLQDRNL